ncbi:hypothetical protein Tco_1128430 [Tanacetum coccineum]
MTLTYIGPWTLLWAKGRSYGPQLKAQESDVENASQIHNIEKISEYSDKCIYYSYTWIWLQILGLLKPVDDDGELVAVVYGYGSLSADTKNADTPHDYALYLVPLQKDTE